MKANSSHPNFRNYSDKRNPLVYVLLLVIAVIIFLGLCFYFYRYVKRRCNQVDNIDDNNLDRNKDGSTKSLFKDCSDLFPIKKRYVFTQEIDISPENPIINTST